MVLYLFTVDRRIVKDMLKYCQDYAIVEDGAQKLYHFFFDGSAFRALYYLEVLVCIRSIVYNVICLSAGVSVTANAIS